MSTVTSSPAALRLFGISIAARLPLAMLTIGVLVHVQGHTGSFAMAGLAAGALAITQGVGGPWLGQLADRHGQTAVLTGSAIVCGAGLAGLAALPSDEPASAVLVFAAVAGFATPPVPACMRALLPGLIPDERSLRRAYAVDSAAVELTWISGPSLVLGIGALSSTGVALSAAAGLLIAFTVLFAATPASRGWRPSAAGSRRTGGALRSDGVRLLPFVMAGAGVLFGTTEAFAWMTTAVAIGTSAGAASARLLAEHAGPGATFLLAGIAAGAVAALAPVASHALPGLGRGLARQVLRRKTDPVGGPTSRVVAARSADKGRGRRALARPLRGTACQ